eukprot:NODE_106_length_19857_cov_0.799980.p11 type:complete len:139 gc:universal NODE_106_length_19857_cov_0.799980:18959-18543(-)
MSNPTLVCIFPLILICRSENIKGMTRLSLWGIVVKKSSPKTVKVRVERDYLVPLINKTIMTPSHYLCHDENDVGQVGDIIRMEQIPKISPRKYFNISEIILPSLKRMTKRGHISIIEGHEIGLKKYQKTNTSGYKIRS